MPIDPTFSDRVPLSGGDNNFFNRNSARQRIPTGVSFLLDIDHGSIVELFIFFFSCSCFHYHWLNHSCTYSHHHFCSCLYKILS